MRKGIMWIVVITEVFFNSHHCSSALENMALGKPVWEDRPWYVTENWRGRNAVDGRYTDRSALGGQCVISCDKAMTATLGVDLGRVVSISHIDIYYRTDNQRPNPYTPRMAGFFLYVSNTTSKEDGHLCFHEIQTLEGTPSEDQKINCSVHGRYVIYYNERRTDVVYPSYYSKFAHYELCEIEVYGCSNVGFYGQNCSISCPTNCQERKCDANSGHCPSCVPGYQGPFCSQVCEHHTYGLGCSQSCGNCSNRDPCHHVNGTCLRGCDEGVQGVECKTECGDGFYGINCRFQCSETCNVTRRCQRFTGECDGGCKAGWRGYMCDQKCESGYFGPNCISKCGHCLNTSHCDVMGSCLNGCSVGYTGKLCKEKCSEGSFGLNCANRCNTYCAGNESCNHMTGVCDEGCKKGWKGPLCGEGENKEPLSSSDNNILVICVVVSVVIVVTGSVLNYIYWKRRSEHIVQEREVEFSVENATTKHKEKPEDTSEQYIELQEAGQVNPYEELKA